MVALRKVVSVLLIPLLSHPLAEGRLVKVSERMSLTFPAK